MKKIKKTFFVFLLFFPLYSFCQNYQPSWESLDKRPIPQWYKDAKFGIFIHWGVYSVPAWSPKGQYAEWYQHALQTNDYNGQVAEYHRKKYGADFSYYQFGPMFKAILFDPDAWAKLFEESGAKYIVLTSKHHDGFALWPSKEASKTWGFPWNAMETGPHRDLLGDLFKAVRKTSVHAGMYYSLYEWYNPLWRFDRELYVKEHMWPQMKDLINTYQPDVFWTDGEWDGSDTLWRSKEFLSWLFNESSVKDKVVVNDRWGKEIRFHHAGFYTPEYQPELDFADHYFEESRGMGFSYGYNREEDAWDYNSTQVLILHLLDKVSRGGNFLLDIGPDADGKIPPIMEQRLMEIGKWMKINGEAIYGTTRWKTPFQWSEGRRDYKPKNDDWKTGGDVMLKLTMNPDPGFAVREIFFTSKNKDLYAILPQWPASGKVILKDMHFTSQKVSLLESGRALKFSNKGNNVEIQLPEFEPSKLKSEYAYVIKIENI
ncbi:MAG TPA: alpha-L-fucosidase [Puia sp.]|nr:alpha-L-fucosidase [Puia sp.]